MENIGDLIETNLYGQGLKRALKETTLPPQLAEMLEPLHEKVHTTLKRTMKAFANGDKTTAAEMVESKSAFEEEVARLRQQLLQAFVIADAEQTAVFRLGSEITLSYERIYNLCRRIARVV